MNLIERVLCKLFNYFDIKREDAGDVYLRRWFLYPRDPQTKKGTRRLYLHKFYRGDEDPHLHNHPWRFSSLILWGGYWEHSFNPHWLAWKFTQPLLGRHHADEFPEPTKTVRKWYGPLSYLKRGPKWAHKVELRAGRTAWTLFLTGHKENEWGFLTDEGFCHHRNYHNGVCWCLEPERLNA